MKNVNLNSFTSDQELARAAAERWLKAIDEANHNHEPHCVALSGGRITKAFLSQVAEESRARGISFSNVHFFWADERCVPPDDPESNFKLAEDLLFKPLRISAGNIHRLKGELSPHTAVENAHSELRHVAHISNGQPVLDLVFLGMGEDGHIASLFPNASTAILNCESPFLFVTDSPKPPPTRISLSYSALINAQEVWVLVSGAGKENALRESLSKDGNTPLGRLLKRRQKTEIFTDIRLPQGQ